MSLPCRSVSPRYTSHCRDAISLEEGNERWATQKSTPKFRNNSEIIFCREFESRNTIDETGYQLPKSKDMIGSKARTRLLPKLTRCRAKLLLACADLPLYISGHVASVAYISNLSTTKRRSVRRSWICRYRGFMPIRLELYRGLWFPVLKEQSRRGCALRTSSIQLHHCLLIVVVFIELVFRCIASPVLLYLHLYHLLLLCLEHLYLLFLRFRLMSIQVV